MMIRIFPSLIKPTTPLKFCSLDERHSSKLRNSVECRSEEVSMRIFFGMSILKTIENV